MNNFFAQSNFVDIIIIILALRICYIAAQMGLVIELFKLAGVLFSTYIALHYYTILSDVIQRFFFSKEMPLEFIDFLVFLSLITAAYLGSIVLRSIFYRFMKLEAVPTINRIGGIAIGIVRAYFLIGLFVFIFSISSVNYLSSSVKHSYLGSRAFSISPRAYHWIFNSIVSKFSAKEKLNPTIDEVSARFNRK